MILLYWAEGKKDRQTKNACTERSSEKPVAQLYCFSFIEGCQLFLKIGTFQLTDLVFNSLGGLLGGLIYWGFDRSRKYISENVQKK